jgi:hypothetical protein
VKLTPEQLRQNAAAMVAHSDGKPIQFKRLDDGPNEWRTPLGGECWNLDTLQYRPKPEPKTRPWSKPEDVPGPLCWIRNESGAEWLVLSVHKEGIHYSGSDWNHRTLDFSKLNYYEHSTDRKIWLPCVVSEEVRS